MNISIKDFIESLKDIETKSHKTKIAILSAISELESSDCDMIDVATGLQILVEEMEKE